MFQTFKYLILFKLSNENTYSNIRFYFDLKTSTSLEMRKKNTNKKPPHRLFVVSDSSPLSLRTPQSKEKIKTNEFITTDSLQMTS